MNIKEIEEFIKKSIDYALENNIQISLFQPMVRNGGGLCLLASVGLYLDHLGLLDPEIYYWEKEKHFDSSDVEYLYRKTVGKLELKVSCYDLHSFLGISHEEIRDVDDGILCKSSVDPGISNYIDLGIRIRQYYDCLNKKKPS